MEAELKELFGRAIELFARREKLQVFFPFEDKKESDGSEVEPDSCHLRVSYLTPRPESIHVEDASGFRKWIAQVDVRVETGGGQYIADEIVDKLIKAFPFSTKFQGSSNKYEIYELPIPSNPVLDGIYFFIPVSFELQTFTKG